MNRLKILMTLLALGAAPRPGLGADPDGPPASPRAETPAAAPPATVAEEAEKRPEPPVPPIKYLQAGANLFNKGCYDLASKYLDAARAYRDRLSASERVVLDVYQEKLDQYLRGLKEVAAQPVMTAPDAAPKPAAAPGGDAAVMTASTSTSSVTNPDRLTDLPPGDAPSSHEPITPSATPGPTAGGAPTATDSKPAMIGGTETWRDTKDAKQKARWLLQLAREQIFRKQYEAAEGTIAEASGIKVRWGYFDDTPAKLTEALSKARAKVAKGPSPGPPAPADQPRDRRAAKARLREARTLLAAGRFDDAERIATDLRTWGLRYGFLEDNPDKLAAELAEARRRASVRDAELTIKSYVTPPGGRTDPPTNP